MANPTHTSRHNITPLKHTLLAMFLYSLQSSVNICYRQEPDPQKILGAHLNVSDPVQKSAHT